MKCLNVTFKDVLRCLPVLDFLFAVLLCFFK